MIFLIKSEYASEEIDSSLDVAIERMCELLKEWPSAFKLTDEQDTIYATAFPGDRHIWAGDTFKHNGKTFGVACVRYYENMKKCPKCDTVIAARKLACEQCTFAAAPVNVAGEHKRAKKGKDAETLDLPFKGGGMADL